MSSLRTCTVTGLVNRVHDFCMHARPYPHSCAISGHKCVNSLLISDGPATVWLPANDSPVLQLRFLPWLCQKLATAGEAQRSSQGNVAGVRPASFPTPYHQQLHVAMAHALSALVSLAVLTLLVRPSSAPSLL